MKTLHFFFTLALMLCLNSTLYAQTYITHDFDDGLFNPYEVNKADQESRVYIVDGAVETHWQQELYNGTNSGRKAQIRPITDIIFTQHIWMGLKIKIHSDYMKDNTNTNAGLMQIWGYNGVSGAANHMCMLKFDGRNGGALVWQHRYNSVANKTHHLVYPNFPRDQFVEVIVHVQLKNNNEGIVQVWADGELMLNETNQTIGWGEMDETGMINGTYCFGTSIGQYNFFESAALDDAYDGTDIMFDGHMEGETRTVTYDNVSLYNGENGFDLVNPNKDISFTPDPNKTYHIDCPDLDLRLAASGDNQNAYTTSTSTKGEDVEWKFTSNGDGSWYIDRAAGGTLPRLTSNDSENATMQDASTTTANCYYTFTTGASFGTHFITLPDGPSDYKRLQVNSSGEVKMVDGLQEGLMESFTITEVVSVNNGSYLLAKNNATEYAINGGGGAQVGRSIQLYSYLKHDNLTWTEIELGNGYFMYQKYNTNVCFDSDDNETEGADVYLSTCDESDENQQWEKTEVSAGVYHLQKRGTSYSLDGGEGGASYQNVCLKSSNSADANQHWRFDDINDPGIPTNLPNGESFSEIGIYPNPVYNQLNISNSGGAILEVFNDMGSLVLNKKVSSNKETIDMSPFAEGMYFIKITKQGIVRTQKVMKQ